MLFTAHQGGQLMGTRPADRQTSEHINLCSDLHTSQPPLAAGLGRRLKYAALHDEIDNSMQPLGSPSFWPLLPQQDELRCAPVVVFAAGAMTNTVYDCEAAGPPARWRVLPPQVLVQLLQLLDGVDLPWILQRQHKHAPVQTCHCIQTDLQTDYLGMSVSIFASKVLRACSQVSCQ